jgi:hypothetical protein
MSFGGIKPRPRAFKADMTATEAELIEEGAVRTYNAHGCPTYFLLCHSLVLNLAHLLFSTSKFMIIQTITVT